MVREESEVGGDYRRSLGSPRSGSPYFLKAGALFSVRGRLKSLPMYVASLQCSAGFEQARYSSSWD